MNSIGMFDNTNLDNWRVPRQKSSTTASSQSFNQEVARLFLEQVLSQKMSPPLSVVEVSRKLGCNRRILYKYSPDLCSAIATIYKNYLQKSCQENNVLVRVVWRECLDTHLSHPLP